MFFFLFKTDLYSYISNLYFELKQSAWYMYISEKFFKKSKILYNFGFSECKRVKDGHKDNRIRRCVIRQGVTHGFTLRSLKKY